MRLKNRIALILFELIILVIGCSKKEQDTKFEIQNIKSENIKNVNLPYEYKREYYGTILVSKVEKHDSQIYENPDLSSKIIGSIEKDQKIIVTGILTTESRYCSTENKWLRIALNEKAEKYWMDNHGWVLADNILVPISITTNDIISVDVIPKSEKRPEMLRLVFQNGKTADVQTYNNINKRYYTFCWSDDSDEYIYNDSFGTFVYYPVVNRILRLSYLGDNAESAWVQFSDDFRYMFKDNGTSTGPRVVFIYDLKDKQWIYGGNYYRSINYNGNTLIVVEVYNETNVDNKYISEKGIMYAEKYIKKHPEEEALKKATEIGMFTELIVKYKYNLDSRTEEYIDCEWIYVQ